MIKFILRSGPLQTLLITVAYFVCGKLALLLALPPGFASSIWPPAGLAIAALLIFGPSRWPGVFLGSLITTWTVSNDPMLLPFFVAAGNTSAALIALTLIRRFLHYPKPFYLEKEILWFLVIAGPVSAVIAASLGTLSLYYFEKIHRETFWINWFYWFIGDASGGIIFAPMALVFSIKSRKYWLRSLSKVIVPLGLCLILLVFSLQYLSKAETSKNQESFRRQADFAAGLLEKDINSFQALLGTLQSFYESSHDVSPEEFRYFTSHLFQRTPEIQSLLWVPLTSQKSYSFPVAYAEPPDKNAHLLKTDLAKHPQYRELILQSLRSAKPITSPPIPGKNSLEVSLALAVSNPRGVIIEIINPHIIMDSLNEFLGDESFLFKISDVTLPHRPHLIVESGGPDEKPRRFDAQFRWSKKISIGSRTWLLEVEQDPTLRPSTTFNTAVFLLTSLIFAFLTCALLLTTANRIITTQAVVEQKTMHLQDINAQLERASKTKSEFLANMSHEIRTPLNVIVGIPDLLEESPLNEHQRKYLDISRKAGDSLLAIINDILDISKIESGLVTLEKTALDVPLVVTEVHEMFTPKALAKGLKFDLFIDAKVKNIYLGDPTRTRQILSNLLGNAIKFTERGHVTLRVLPFNDSQVPGNILFEVEDSGIGISPEVIPQLFKPFSQADSTITRRFGGTGLGLSICKRLIEMMNGSISVTSLPGQGSTFRFTLTLAYVRASASKPNTTKNPDIPDLDPGLKILIVDDADENRMLLRAYLGNAHHIMEADNGLQAVELRKSHDFDIIFMDMQMPGMDGFTAVKKIREYELQRGLRKTPIWALTAYALKNEIQKSLDVGCEKHLSKPIRKHELLKEMAKHNWSRHE